MDERSKCIMTLWQCGFGGGGTTLLSDSCTLPAWEGGFGGGGGKQHCCLTAALYLHGRGGGNTVVCKLHSTCMGGGGGATLLPASCTLPAWEGAGGEGETLLSVSCTLPAWEGEGGGSGGETLVLTQLPNPRRGRGVGFFGYSGFLPFFIG